MMSAPKWFLSKRIGFGWFYVIPGKMISAELFVGGFVVGVGLVPTDCSPTQKSADRRQERDELKGDRRELCV